MAILYYLVFCSALLKPSCYTPRNYFLATDWDAVTAVSVSENIHVQWRQQETSQVRYLTPGTAVKFYSSQPRKQARLIEISLWPYLRLEGQ